MHAEQETYRSYTSGPLIADWMCSGGNTKWQHIMIHFTLKMGPQLGKTWIAEPPTLVNREKCQMFLGAVFAPSTLGSFDVRGVVAQQKRAADVVCCVPGIER